MRLGIIGTGFELYELDDGEVNFGTAGVFSTRAGIAIDSAERPSTRRLVESMIGYLDVEMLYY
jgi:hypothetical protein